MKAAAYLCANGTRCDHDPGDGEAPSALWRQHIGVAAELGEASRGPAQRHVAAGHNGQSVEVDRVHAQLSMSLRYELQPRALAVLAPDVAT